MIIQPSTNKQTFLKESIQEKKLGKYIPQDRIINLGKVKIRLKASESLQQVIRKINSRSPSTGIHAKSIKGELVLEIIKKANREYGGLQITSPSQSKNVSYVSSRRNLKLSVPAVNVGTQIENNVDKEGVFQHQNEFRSQFSLHSLNEIAPNILNESTQKLDVEEDKNSDSSDEEFNEENFYEIAEDCYLTIMDKKSKENNPIVTKVENKSEQSYNTEPQENKHKIIKRAKKQPSKSHYNIATPLNFSKPPPLSIELMHQLDKIYSDLTVLKRNKLIIDINKDLHTSRSQKDNTKLIPSTSSSDLDKLYFLYKTPKSLNAKISKL